MPDARLLHELLPALRAERGLSQSGLSARTVKLGDQGIAVNTIQTYEKAKYAGRIPEVEILEALAGALEVDPGTFYEYPIALARRAARPSVSRRAAEAAQRLDDTPPTSRRKRRAQDDEDQAT